MGEIMKEELIQQPELFEDYPPECVFKAEYPQSFKFDLTVGSKNYGEIRIRIDKGIELSTIEGEKNSLAKLEEIGKKQAGKAAYVADLVSGERIYISYPFKDAGELVVALRANIGFAENKDFKNFCKFVYKVENPVDYELLYQKTGIRIYD